MMRSLRLFAAIGIVMLCGWIASPMSYGAYPSDFSDPLTTIAFGSCNKSHKAQPLWDVILTKNPDLWIWAGDIVYADTTWSIRRILDEYARQKSRPEYRNFLNHVPVIGVWDDHDYGMNDAGKSYRLKNESQQALLDFLDEPADSVRRTREGVYASYEFGPAGRRVKIILLDDRFFRDEPRPANDVLGMRQWKWLRHELFASRADVNILVTSTVLMPVDYGSECWAQYTRAREKLFKYIRRVHPKGLIVLSGDLHFGDISRMDHFFADGTDLYEVTSSGMTHFNISSYRNQKNRFSVVERPLFGLNFGLVTIDWGRRPDDPIRVRYEVYDREANPALQAEQVFSR